MAGTNNSWNNQVNGSYNQIILNAGVHGVEISSDASAAVVDIATGNATKALTIGSGSTGSSTVIHSGSTGGMTIDSLGGTLAILSRTGALNISADNNGTTIQIGTGPADKSVSIGSIVSTSLMAIHCGTGGVFIGTDALDHPTNIGSFTGASAAIIDCGTGGASFGTSANAHTTTIGSTTAASTTVIQAPSAGVILTGVQGVAVANKNYVTINTATGAIGSDAGPSGGSALTITSVNNAASPYTVLVGDQFLAVDTSGGAVSILLPNAPTTGRVIYVKDSTGTAAASNITVTTVGGAVNIDGATTFVMNTARESINVVFDSVAYEVF